MRYISVFLLIIMISCKTSVPVYGPVLPIPVHPINSIPATPLPGTPETPTDTIIPPPIGYADYSLYFQIGWDSAIAHNLPFYFIPAGRWPMQHPLIGRRATNNTYVFWRTDLIGAGTAGESDGSGTILDFTLAPRAAFGIGVQAAKGVIIRGIKVWGAFNRPVTSAYSFYNTSLSDYTDGVCRDSRYSPYSGIVVDPFGPSVPADGGFPGNDAYGNPLSSYYLGSQSGSTGIHVTECFITGWVVDIITSPNGQTANADNCTFDFLQVGNSKINFAGCQDQEKNNVIAHVQSWGVTHTVFATNLYGAGSVGNWFLDFFNIAGYTQQIIYNNQTGYYPTYLSHIYAESIARIGPWYSINGSKMSESTIGFAGPDEAGTYTPDQFSGYGVTMDGCQFRMYGWPLPVTISTGPGANDFHFISCAFEGGVPVYPQTYPYGYTDFLNCYMGGRSSASRLNPFGPSGSIVNEYAYPSLSKVAGQNVFMDPFVHKFTRSGSHFETVFTGDSAAINDVIVATTDFVTYTVAGFVTAKQPGSYTVSYTSPAIDTSKSYYIYKWKTLYK